MKKLCALRIILALLVLPLVEGCSSSKNLRNFKSGQQPSADKTVNNGDSSQAKSKKKNIEFENAGKTVVMDKNTVIKWDGVENADSYAARVANRKDCTDIEVIVDGLKTPEFKLPNLIHSGPFYLCVDAFDKDGRLINQSDDGQAFSIKAGTKIFSKDVALDGDFTLFHSEFVGQYYYISGVQENVVGPTSGKDIVMVRISEDGNVDPEFRIEFDSNGQDDMNPYFSIDAMGKIYIAYASTNFVGPTSGLDFTVMKFLSDGTPVLNEGWPVKLDSGDSHDAAQRLTFHPDGDILVGGYIDREAVLKKFQPSGDEVTFGWDKVYPGNAGNDFVGALEVKGDAIYLAGYGARLVSSGSGFDWYIRKYDLNGTEDMINFPVYENHSDTHDRVFNLSFYENGDLFLFGKSENAVAADSKQDSWLQRFDSDGVPVMGWNQVFDGGKQGNDQGRDVVINSKGTVFTASCGENLIAGTTAEDSIIRKFHNGGFVDDSFSATYDLAGDYNCINTMKMNSRDDLATFEFSLGLSTASNTVFRIHVYATP